MRLGREMERHGSCQQDHERGSLKKISGGGGRSFQGCCCWPCNAVSSVFRGIGRCMFVSCYPVMQCFGLDDCRHHHHHRKHFH